MKHLLPLVLFIFFVTTSFSQINKGQWLTGGSGSYRADKYPWSDNRYRSLRLDINGGYFPIKNLAVGVRTIYNYDRQTGTSDNASYFKQTSNSKKLAPFVRYYFLPAGKKINLLADASYYRGWEKSTNLSGHSTSKYGGYAFSAGPAWFITSHTALELLVQYDHVFRDYNYAPDFTYKFGFQIHLDAKSPKTKAR